MLIQFDDWAHRHFITKLKAVKSAVTHIDGVFYSSSSTIGLIMKSVQLKEQDVFFA
jgi:hypothetical protein